MPNNSTPDGRDRSGVIPAGPGQQHFRVCRDCGESFATNVGQDVIDGDFLAILREHQVSDGCVGGFRRATEEEAF